MATKAVVTFTEGDRTADGANPCVPVVIRAAWDPTEDPHSAHRAAVQVRYGPQQSAWLNSEQANLKNDMLGDAAAPKAYQRESGPRLDPHGVFLCGGRVNCAGKGRGGASGALIPAGQVASFTRREIDLIIYPDLTLQR